MKQIKELWFRDRAFDMKRPSIDRKDNDLDYTFDNCRFLELGYNSGKNKQKPIFQCDLNGKIIREWNSIKEASETLKVGRFNISSNLIKNSKTAFGFIWKYKN